VAPVVEGDDLEIELFYKHLAIFLVRHPRVIVGEDGDKLFGFRFDLGKVHGSGKPWVGNVPRHIVF